MEIVRGERIVPVHFYISANRVETREVETQE